MIVVRENSEGLYSGAGGFHRKGTPYEVAVQESINTRHGVERIVRYAFELAMRPDRRRKLTLVGGSEPTGASQPPLAKTEPKPLPEPNLGPSLVVPAAGDVASAVREFKAGKVEYRSDKTGQIHAGVGKMSFDDDKIIANIQVFVDTVRAAKPSGVKGNYINGIVLSATMCPGIRVSV